MTFSLYAETRAVLDESPVANPHELVSALMLRIPPKERALVLAQLLTGYIRLVAANQRTPEPFMSDADEVDESESRPSAGHSWKVSGIRDGWAKLLDQRVHNGAEWKFLGDCTADDLLSIAGLRREAAAKNAAVAERFEGYAKILTDHGVERLRDVPREALGDAA